MYLTERVRLKPQLAIVQDFFNFLPPTRFLFVMDQLAKGIGYDDNGVGCTTAGEDDDEPDSGAVFYIGEHIQVWISDEDVYEIFSQALQAHLANHPGDETVVRGLLMRGRATWIGA